MFPYTNFHTFVSVFAMFRRQIRRTETFGYVVVDALTAGRCELFRIEDEGAELIRGEACMDLIAGYALADETVGKAGVEIIASADGADNGGRVTRRRTVGRSGLKEGGGEGQSRYYLNGLWAAGVDEGGGVASGEKGCREMFAEHLFDALDAKENAEVFVAATKDVGQAEILFEIGKRVNGDEITSFSAAWEERKFTS